MGEISNVGEVLSAHDTVKSMLDIMTDSKNPLRIALETGTSVAVLLNNLGATSETEMNILAKEIIEQLEKRGVKVDRAYLNRFATSQEMAGFGISLLPLDDQLKKFLDMQTSAPAWVKAYLPFGCTDRVTGTDMVDEHAITIPSYAINFSGAQLSKEDGIKLRQAIEAACEALLGAKDELNNLDSACGDGDCGSTIASGAQAVLTDLHSSPYVTELFSFPRNLCLHLSQILENTMGGCSGALYSILFTSAASELKSTANLESLQRALYTGIRAMQTYGGAKLGDRTMLDPLNAAHESLSAGRLSGKALFEHVAQSVEDAAQGTASMEARAGRASYVGREHQKQPDAGAVAVAIWIKASLLTWMNQ